MADLSEHVESCSSTNKDVVSINAMPTGTKRGRVGTYDERLPPIKSHDPLSTWFSENT